ncbi:MAG TPA: methylated-DNA--[protein]-cysteine S-methyltransferase [Candidatus Angelobacter sp.]|nr:methylated-DNA--[protein]-cysteine S-methyltransferase [Candidatus Angelobacter sp.]
MPEAGKIYYWRVQSAVGALLLAATEKGLCRLQFGAQLPAGQTEPWIESRERLHPCEEQLKAYFRGDLREFTLPLDLRGTPFQLRCWEVLRRIPYGRTCSYAELAEQVGSPRAFRAVGQANHNNPVATVVPCHRVIGANGTLTGYGGGLNVKQALLQLEAGQFPGLFSL